MSIRYKGKDRIELGYNPYAEAAYGGSPGAVPTTLYRIGHMQTIEPLYDPELTRIFALRDDATPAALALLRKRENVKLRFTWNQATIANYWQKETLNDHDNFFMEAKVYRDAGSEIYLYWTGIKLDKLRVRCSLGEEIEFQADTIGKLYDTKTSTIHSYGAVVGTPWDWSQAYVEISTNDADWTTVPDVTDWEFLIDNQLKPNFVFNSTGSKQLSSLEEMEQLSEATLTMNLMSTTYINYLTDQDALYLKLMLPDSKWIKLNLCKASQGDPILKPEDLISVRVKFIGKYMTHNFT